MLSDKNLQLLFSILEGNDEPSLRANLVIAIGDITKRFPNLIKPWTGHIYRRLRDADPRVRKHTLYRLFLLLFLI
jgi:condensin complex subunit 1